FEPAAGGRGVVLLEQLAQRVDRLAEDRGLAARVQLELQLGGVLDPAVSRLHAVPSACGWASRGTRRTLREAARGNQICGSDRIVGERLGTDPGRKRLARPASADAQPAIGRQR